MYLAQRVRVCILEHVNIRRLAGNESMPKFSQLFRKVYAGFAHVLNKVLRHNFYLKLLLFHIVEDACSGLSFSKQSSPGCATILLLVINIFNRPNANK